MTPPRVFISYAWGDEDAWVEEFATRLRADGVDARLDRWELHPGDEIAAFMEEQVRESTFVLFICTPKFREKANERKGGVGYEAMIATAEVLARREEVARKFIPVHRSGDWVDAAASWLLGKYLIDLRGAPYAEANYQDLLGALLNRRRGPPPIGTPATPGGGSGVALPPSPSSPVAASGPKAGAALERLLLDLFSPSELRRFVAHQPGGDDLAAHLPSSGSPADYAHELVALLQRRGHINSELFDAIVAERRGRSADVATVRRQFGL